MAPVRPFPSIFIRSPDHSGRCSVVGFTAHGVAVTGPVRLYSGVSPTRLPTLMFAVRASAPVFKVKLFDNVELDLAGLAAAGSQPLVMVQSPGASIFHTRIDLLGTATWAAIAQGMPTTSSPTATPPYPVPLHQPASHHSTYATQARHPGCWGQQVWAAVGCHAQGWVLDLSLLDPYVPAAAPVCVECFQDSHCASRRGSNGFPTLTQQFYRCIDKPTNVTLDAESACPNSGMQCITNNLRLPSPVKTVALHLASRIISHHLHLPLSSSTHLLWAPAATHATRSWLWCWALALQATFGVSGGKISGKSLVSGVRHAGRLEWEIMRVDTLLRASLMFYTNGRSLACPLPIFRASEVGERGTASVGGTVTLRQLCPTPSLPFYVPTCVHSVAQWARVRANAPKAFPNLVLNEGISYLMAGFGPLNYGALSQVPELRDFLYVATQLVPALSGGKIPALQVSGSLLMQSAEH
ncbi:hypothetical protein HaLaN_08117 [Haematococcus lacustris]|uniref:Uncharacterized protein n=1 Tax=Haematococcus lacustris TaxID=44745 RepID=A0A699YQ40_HAELA|nr:hypothetical protein HaLaN_08117 [Haematococcus lacustris]